MRKVFCVLFLISFFNACKDKSNHDSSDVNQGAIVKAPMINYYVVATYPHDTNSFTEGLFVHNDKVYESTGSPEGLPSTRSLFGIVDLKTGIIDKKVELDKQKYFGEGIAILNKKVYQLTYTSRIGFIYSELTFIKLGEFTIPGKEGWGLTTDTKSLIVTNGTSSITYLDSASLAPTKILRVTEGSEQVENLNELEFINGYIYANVYTTNTIVKIDTASGKVVGRIDLSSLAHDASSKHYNSLEMNGVAFDASKKTILVTGKMWPTIYEIKLPL